MGSLKAHLYSIGFIGVFALVVTLCNLFPMVVVVLLAISLVIGVYSTIYTIFKDSFDEN